jgi:CheY-like chemotaxis protein
VRECFTAAIYLLALLKRVHSFVFISPGGDCCGPAFKIISFAGRSDFRSGLPESLKLEQRAALTQIFIQRTGIQKSKVVKARPPSSAFLFPKPTFAFPCRLGVDLAKTQKPDLILCDVMMPGLDGYGVIAALRADAETATIPIIFLTAKAEKLDVCAGMNLGADDYITKPVAKADLLAVIRSRLERAIQQAVPQFKPNLHSDVARYAKYDVQLDSLPA